MEDYKPNSHRSKEDQPNSVEKKEISKVVTGKVVKKKNVGRKLTDMFISEDVNNIKSYVIMDVLVPAVKKAISDIVTNGIDMMLYGETGRTKKTSSGSISYRDYYDSNRNRDNRYTASRTRYSYDDIVLDSRTEAEEVLVRMQEIIDTYQVVSVADLYDLVGIRGSFTDNKYGWTNIRNASVEHVRDGYMLKLPKALAID